MIVICHQVLLLLNAGVGYTPATQAISFLAVCCRSQRRVARNGVKSRGRRKNIFARDDCPAGVHPRHGVPALS
jgi:hypothetical protein